MPPTPDSTGARLGRAAAALVQGQRPRVGVRSAGSVTRALGRGGRHFLGRVGQVLGHIGLYVAAVLYLALSLSFGAAGVAGWLAFHHQPGQHAASLTQAPPLTQLELALALVFLYFAFSSWLRASRRA